jgi:hypothetical protein
VGPISTSNDIFQEGCGAAALTNVVSKKPASHAMSTHRPFSGKSQKAQAPRQVVTNQAATRRDSSRLSQGNESQLASKSRPQTSTNKLGNISRGNNNANNSN